MSPVTASRTEPSTTATTRTFKMLVLTHFHHLQVHKVRVVLTDVYSLISWHWPLSTRDVWFAITESIPPSIPTAMSAVTGTRTEPSTTTGTLSTHRRRDSTVQLNRVGGVNGSRDLVYNFLCCWAISCKIVNWVATADGCVHTADTTRQLRRVGVASVYIGL